LGINIEGRLSENFEHGIWHVEDGRLRNAAEETFSVCRKTAYPPHHSTPQAIHRTVMYNGVLIPANNGSK
jgi:hypothetical protein